MASMDWGEVIRPHIPTARDEWATSDEIVRRAQAADPTLYITTYHVYQGVRALREDEPGAALVSNRCLGYRFTLDQEEVTTYRRWRCRMALSMIRVCWVGAVKPFVEATFDKRQARAWSLMFERVIEDLENIAS